MRSRTKKVALVLALFGLTAFAELKLETGLFVNTAQAVVGRPLTPVSYAGVARRTTRRSAGYGYAAPGVW
jgi:hypothetical protein